MNLVVEEKDGIFHIDGVCFDGSTIEAELKYNELDDCPEGQSIQEAIKAELEALGLLDDEKMWALAAHTGDCLDQIAFSEGNEYTIGRTTYLVVTDSEADSEMEAYIDNYIEEIILPEIPELYHQFIDEEKVAFSLKMDGRGSALASYDGIESFSGDYYIYRTN